MPDHTILDLTIYFCPQKLHSVGLIHSTPKNVH